jgi:hypothetical protein
MDSEQVNRRIDEIERHLRIDDPALVRRAEQQHRRDAAQAIAVFAFLAFSVVLLVAGLVALSPVAYCVGVAAFLAAFVADRQLAPPDDLSKTPRRLRR